MAQTHDTPTILLVDDEVLILKSLQRYLESEGMPCLQATDGERALEILAAEEVDIVVSDLKMPVMDGIELLRRIQADFPECTTIAMTGHSTMETAIQALRHGAFDYLLKPINMEELVIVIRRAVRQRHQELELGRTREQLYHAQKMDALGRLAGGVAHQFNNLMGGILGYADLAMRTKREDLRDRAFEACVQGARRASQIAVNLLRFARRGRGMAQAMDLEAILRETVDLLRMDLEQDHVRIELNIRPVPPTEGDADQIQQLILNLLVNAGQALNRVPAQERRLLISLAAEEDRIGLEIADSGPGIPTELRSRVFEPFFSTRGLLDGTKEENAAGLGLSVALGIAQAHGGELEIHPRENGGTRTRLHLPIHAPTRVAVERILLVDDEEHVRRIMSAVLAKCGFAVDTAADGKEALAALAREEYALVLLDQNMPGMSGLEFLRAMGRRTRSIPVVMVTAVKEDRLAQDAVLAGARECVFKPVNNHKLIALAAKYCRPLHRDTTCAPPAIEEMTDKVILVVEPDTNMRDIYGLLLRQQGFAVYTCEDLDAALEQTRTRYFDCIIVDVIPDPEHGEATVRRIRANNPYTPLLLCTTEASPDLISCGLRQGASGVMEKPINANAFVEQVRQLIALYQPVGVR